MALLDAATYKLPDAEVLYLITPEAAKQTDQVGAAHARDAHR